MISAKLVAAAAALAFLSSAVPPAPATRAAQALPKAPAPRPFTPTRFSVQVRGTGPDVILIPGLTAGRAVWNGTVAAVPGYRYHMIQVAGFAGDPARGNARGAIVAPLADEIARYIETRRLDRPALVGHSMGGTLAMMIAARHPARVGKVMVVDMLPQPAGLLGSTAGDLGPLAETLRGMTASPSGRRLLESLIGSFAEEEAPARRSDADVVGRAMHELANTDLTADLPRIRAPMTVVYASPHDRSRPRVERSYAAAYAGKRDARLVRVDDSGHMIMYDRPQAFRAALKEFLSPE